MDNASSHKSSGTIEAIEKAECELLFLPLYSSDLSPIENFLGKFERKVKEAIKTYSNLAETMDYMFLEVCK